MTIDAHANPQQHIQKRWLSKLRIQIDWTLHCSEVSLYGIILELSVGLYKLAPYIFPSVWHVIIIGLSSVIMLKILQSFVFWKLNSYNILVTIFIFIGVLSMLLYIFFDEKFYFFVFVQILGVVLWMLLSSRSFLSTKSRILPMLSALLAFTLTVWCACQGLYILFQRTVIAQSSWDYLWQLFIPTTPNVINNCIEKLPLLSAGITFLSGCLLIIAWAKERPCANWNPFTARELLLSNRAIYMSLAVLLVLSFSLTIEAYRLAFLSFMVLCAANVAIAFYCHQLQSTEYITQKVIDYLLRSGIHRSFSKQLSLSDISTINTDEISLDHSDIMMKSKEFVERMQSISSTAIKHMRENISKNQVELMFEFINRIQRQVKKAEVAVGFLLGLGCIPPEVDDEVLVCNYIFYLSELFSNIYPVDGTSQSIPDYQAAVMLGMLVGSEALRLQIKNRTIRVKEEENSENMIRDEINCIIDSICVANPLDTVRDLIKRLYTVIMPTDDYNELNIAKNSNVLVDPQKGQYFAELVKNTCPKGLYCERTSGKRRNSN